MASVPTTGAQICAQYHLTPEQFAALPLCERALFRAAYAADVLHVQEVPKDSNRGPDVDRYITSVGLQPPQFWCAAFASCMLLDSGANRHALPAGAASVHEWLTWAQQHGHLLAAPKRACAGLIIESPTAGHFVLVSAVTGPTVHTIEGNTNNDGSRNGYGVFRRERGISSIAHFVDLSFLG